MVCVPLDADGSNGDGSAIRVPLQPSASASPSSRHSTGSGRHAHSHRTPLLSAADSGAPSDSPTSSTGFVSIASPAASSATSPSFNVHDANRSNYSSVAATHSPKPKARRIMNHANQDDSPVAASRFSVQTGAEQTTNESTTTGDEAHRLSNGSSARPSPSSSVNAQPDDTDKDVHTDDTVLAVKRAPGEHPDGEAPVYTHLGHQFLPGQLDDEQRRMQTNGATHPLAFVCVESIHRPPPRNTFVSSCQSMF